MHVVAKKTKKQKNLLTRKRKGMKYVEFRLVAIHLGDREDI